jgi:hypothetical protein
VQEGAHRDIDEQARAAGQAEADIGADQRQAPLAPVIVGDGVVDHEVGGHGDEGRGQLHAREGQGGEGPQQAREGDIDQESGRADQGEHHRPGGDQAAGGLVQDQAEVFDHHPPVELALSGLALAEAVGQLGHAQGAFVAGQEVEQHLEAFGGQARGGLFPDGAAGHEIAADGVGDGILEHQAAHPGRQAATLLAGAAEAGRQALRLQVAAGDHEVGAVLAQELQHGRQQGLIVLQVGVDDGDEGRGAGQGALQHRAGEASAADAAQALHPAVLPRQGLDLLRRAVRGVVIDEDHLPGDGLERRIELGHQGPDVGEFVEGWGDHGQFENTGL